jgi:hypothetical protein
VVVGRDILKLAKTFKADRAASPASVDGSYDAIILNDGFLYTPDEIARLKAMLCEGGLLYTKAVYMKSWHFAGTDTYEYVSVTDDRSLNKALGMAVLERRVIAWSPEKPCIEEFLFRN